LRAFLLTFFHVADSVLEIGVVIDPLVVAALREPTAPPGLLCNTFLKSLRVRELPRAPGLELITHFFWIAIRGHDDVDMVRPRVHRMEYPAADAAVVGNRLFDQLPLLGIKPDDRFGHSVAGIRFKSGVGRQHSRGASLDPST